MSDSSQQFYSATYLAEALGVDRETIHRALRNGRLEAPIATLNPGGKAKPIHAWSHEQLERIKATWEPGKPGRPRTKGPGDPPHGGSSNSN